MAEGNDVQLMVELYPGYGPSGFYAAEREMRDEPEGSHGNV